MATTFKRLKTLTEFSNSQKDWKNDSALADELRKSKHIDFKTTGTGKNVDDYMKINTSRKLINYAIELGLLEKIGKSENVRISAKGISAIVSEDAYKRQIKSSVKSFLTNKKVPLSDILNTVDKIKLPNLPDITTIYENLDDQSKISEKDLRKAMFLLALAEGIDRKTKVVYLK